VIAFGEVARPIRLLNIPMGLWLAGAAWQLSGATDVSRWSELIIGAALIVLSLPRGRIGQRFGSWNRYLI
jgi:SPW repeat-containing protein